jgi:hypothetical protein
VANAGLINWVVTESGDLLVVPHSVGREPLEQDVVRTGQSVMAAGEARIAVGGESAYLIQISSLSSHSLTDQQSLDIGHYAFQRDLGLTFASVEDFSAHAKENGPNGGSHHEENRNNDERDQKRNVAGGDNGDNGGNDGPPVASDEHGRDRDLSAVRAAYPELDQRLIQIEEKLRAQERAQEQADPSAQWKAADLFQIIEEVSQQKSIVGFAEWVDWSAGREAERMLDMVMELVEARRLLEEHLASDPSVRVYIGQDKRKGHTFDIQVEGKLDDGNRGILRQIEVFTPDQGIKNRGDLLSAITHAASKIPLGVRDGTESLPPGSLEATIAAPWPPAPFYMKGDGLREYDINGNYRGYSITDPTVTRGKNGNILDDLVAQLNRMDYNNPIESVTRLTVIDLTGQALFELTNETPNVIPSRWEKSNLQGQ